MHDNPLASLPVLPNVVSRSIAEDGRISERKKTKRDKEQNLFPRIPVGITYLFVLEKKV